MYPPNLYPITFPVHDVVLVDFNVKIRINPISGSNNNHQMEKITVSYIGGVHFNFNLSMDNY